MVGGLDLDVLVPPGDDGVQLVGAGSEVREVHHGHVTLPTTTTNPQIINDQPFVMTVTPIPGTSLMDSRVMVAGCLALACAKRMASFQSPVDEAQTATEWSMSCPTDTSRRELALKDM